ncbi:MAG: minor capsid protein [Paludibacteraceae bacterium]|nr:minor capsid protein [Paludibacteraceae bacterium]
MSNYWQDRIANNLLKTENKTIKQINAQLIKYYGRAAERVVREFEATYNKLLNITEEGKEPSPADLYKLDKYWELQAQLRQELQKLGDKEIQILTKAFEVNYFEVYYGIALPGEETFSTLDTLAAQQLINSVWVADGKNWSQRVWDNTERLAQTLNEELIHIVATGKKTTELKNILQERFNISYRRAETLVRTEVAHIQTEAAKKRYQDYGIKYVEVLVDPDERTCDLCKALIGKKFPVNETPPLPVHPNERCCLVPVI